MSKSITEIARHPTRFGALLALGLAALLVAVLNAGATPPSNFVALDGFVRAQNTGTPPPFDWANSGTAGGTNTCTGSQIHVSGVNGLFDCGQFVNNTTNPIPPNYIGPGSGSPSFVTANTFIVDSLSTDVGETAPGTSTVCGKGDSTVYTGAGGEKNGDPLIGKGVETYALSTVPAKDEISNVYAIARRNDSGGVPILNELFFGAERVVNNGDSHVDFEFLQSQVATTNVSACSSSHEGDFNGHRTEGDTVVSVDYETGGAIGSLEVNQWHCNTDVNQSDAKGWQSLPPGPPFDASHRAAIGTTCDASSCPASGCAGVVAAGTGPHYQEVACVDFDLTDQVTCPGAVSGNPATANNICGPPVPAGGCAPGIAADAATAVTNGGGARDCGGWACRDSSGNLVSTIGQNELMEGGVNLLSLGFTGCISTFLPHTRSSASFTATLKDFALHSFNSCRPTTSLSVSPSASQLVHAGDSKTFTYSEVNDGNVSLTSPHVNVTTTGGTLGANCTSGPSGGASFTGGDTNTNGILDPGETWTFACTVTFGTTGVFTVTGVGHGTFNGQDITFPGDQDERAQTEVRVISPATTLTKSPSATKVHSGDTVTYTYTETNGTTGGNVADRDISSVSITDDKCSPVALQSGDTNSDNKLNAGETWTFTCSVSLTATTTNTATATGTDTLGTTVTFCANPSSPPSGTICSQTEQAQATVTVINPTTSLSKTEVVKVTYSYTESNTSAASADNDLTNPSVSDDKCSPVVQDLKADGVHNTGDANNDGKLNPGETWNFHCSTTVTLLSGTGTVSVQNTATATATDSLGAKISDETDKLTVSVTVTKP